MKQRRVKRRVRRLTAEIQALEALEAELQPHLSRLFEHKGIGPDGRVRATLLALTDRLIARELARLASMEGVTAPCPCGGEGRRKEQRERTAITVGGTVTYLRSVYQCNGCGKRFSPLDDELGLVDGSDCTAALRELIGFIQAEEPAEMTAETLSKLLGFEIASSVVDRATQVEGARAEEANKRFPAAAERAPKTLLVEVDGCQVPFRDGWHETKIGVVADAAYRVEKPPSAGEIARAKLAGRAPRGREMLGRKAYVASCRSLDEFKDRLWNETERQGGSGSERIVLVGDGAKWIWNLGEELFRFPETPGWGRPGPKLVCIVDWFHAVEHLWRAGELIHGDRGSRKARSWVRCRETRLWEKGDAGGVARCIRAAARGRRGEAREELLREAAYFANNADRMNYPAYRGAGLPVGSGPAEGACKTVVQARCKRAGMRWSEEGASHVLALRACRLNGRWHELWPDAA